MIKLGEVIMILDLHRQGLSVSAIVLQLGIDRKTVRKYIARGLEPPVYGPRQPRTRRIDRSAPVALFLRNCLAIMREAPSPLEPLPPAQRSGNRVGSRSLKSDR